MADSVDDSLIDSVVNREISHKKHRYQVVNEKVEVVFPNGPATLYLPPSLQFREGGKYEWNFQMAGNTSFILGPVPTKYVHEFGYLYDHRSLATVGLRNTGLIPQATNLPKVSINTNPIRVTVDLSSKTIEFIIEREKNYSFHMEGDEWDDGFSIGICGFSNTKAILEPTEETFFKPAKKN